MSGPANTIAESFPTSHGLEASLQLGQIAGENWTLIEDGFTLAREHEIESLFTVSNGYAGTRASLAEGNSLSSPATFLAGVFAQKPVCLSQIAVCPDWTRVLGKVDDCELKLESGEILEHRRILDMQQGIFLRNWRHRQPNGRISRVAGLRLASLADRHLLFQSILFTPENYSGSLHLEIGLTWANDDFQLVRIDRNATGCAGTQDVQSLSFVVLGNGTVAFAFATKLSPKNGVLRSELVCRSNAALEEFRFDVEIGKTYRLDRFVCVYTGDDGVLPAESAEKHLTNAIQVGAERNLQEHVRAWHARWHDADIEIEGDEAAQRALRFACYHLISAADPQNEHVSIGARSLTGSAYSGHVFWDTEIYMLPFYMLTHPASARALLMYRYHTLAAARDKAKSCGYKGALFPWEAARTGEEATPRYAFTPNGQVITVRNGEQEHHISADIAHGVWQYWQISADDDFLLQAGAEILIETARFWASRGKTEADGFFHIRHVIGPDEYHEDVDDNVYTNLMAKWNLETAVEAAHIIEDRWPDVWSALSTRLVVSDSEIQNWSRLAASVYTGFDSERGVFQQFGRYFDLEEIDLSSFEPRTTAIELLMGRERIQRSKAVKQADVIMALYLLWEHVPPDVRGKNFRYYAVRTAHGSSLSPAMHALVAARLGEMSLAQQYFKQAIEIDLANNMGNAAGGVHMGALGGLWQAVVFGFAGLQLREDGLDLDPKLPPNWTALRFPLRWRKSRLRFSFSREPLVVEVEVQGDGGIQLAIVAGPNVTLKANRKYRTDWSAGTWQGWQEVGS